MTQLVIDGCRTVPLGGYLQALGLLRAVSRLLDPAATGHWERGRFVLGSRFTSVDDLATTLLGGFEPEAIISPWNAGSGFAGNNKNPAAERTLQAIRESAEPRLASVRDAVLAGDKVVEKGRARTWGGIGDKLWDEKHKPDVLTLCRAEFPDGALPWLDAVVVLGQDGDPAYSRLLGTGGNFGRQDLSSNYLQRAQLVLSDRRSSAWVRALLTGDEAVPYLRETVGQFDPGRAGGIQSSPWEKADDTGFLNPWAYLLTVEGALLFAGALVRRHGAENARAALPFQVRGATAGFGSAAVDEALLGEIWMPEWSRAARLDEIAHFLAEGRAEWCERQARSGLDFVRSIAALGVDRGIDAFHRHVFVDRHGQSPLAVPAGRVAVPADRRGPLRILERLDGWLDRVRAAPPPAGVAVALRRVDAALFALACSGGTPALVDVLAATGALHEAVSRSGAVRGRVAPLILLGGREVLDELEKAAVGDPALRLALALATARDEYRPGDAGRPHRIPATLGGLRSVLSPVKGPRMAWTREPVSVSLHAGLVPALAQAARRRSLPGTVHEIKDASPALLGVRMGFQRGCRLRVADGATLLRGAVDHDRAADLLAGLLTVDWSRAPDTVLLGQGDEWPDPARDLLVCFSGTEPLQVPGPDGSMQEAWLRPGSHWPAALLAGHAGEVLADAAHRLRISGVRFVAQPVGTDHDGAFLASLLLLPTTEAQRKAALTHVAALPDPPKTRNQETPA